MFWTAFIWGIGVSFGAAFGLIAYFVMFWSLEWLVGRTADKLDYKKNARDSLAALILRNELTEETNGYLEQIARAARHISAEKER